MALRAPSETYTRLGKALTEIHYLVQSHAYVKPLPESVFHSFFNMKTEYFECYNLTTSQLKSFRNLYHLKIQSERDQIFLGELRKIFNAALKLTSKPSYSQYEFLINGSFLQELIERRVISFQDALKMEPNKLLAIEALSFNLKKQVISRSLTVDLALNLEYQAWKIKFLCDS